MGDDGARRDILARRARFVAAALASVGLVTGAVACGGDTKRDGKRTADAGDAGDAAPEPCLGAPADASPEPCLGVTPDASPEPCLSPPAPDER